jgi:membrane protein implicated in regulation of membrane protease activity
MREDRNADPDDQQQAVTLFIYLVVFLGSSGISSSYGLGPWASLVVGLVISALGALAHRRWVTHGRHDRSLSPRR